MAGYIADYQATKKKTVAHSENHLWMMVNMERVL